MVPVAPGVDRFRIIPGPRIWWWAARNALVESIHRRRR